MRKLFILFFITLPFINFSQIEPKKNTDSIISENTFVEFRDTTDLKVYLKTDIKYASSAADTRKEAQSATGTLGMKFEKGYLFGSAVFTIHSQNEQISTTDDSERKLFGTSLLLPQNSSSNISNFELHLGANSFYKRKKYSELRGNDFYKFMHTWLQPIGCQIIWRVNNTVWEKSQITVPVTISSFSVDMTYRILDVKMDNFGDDRVKLIFSVGYNSRRLGGDYGLDENSSLRYQFLGSDKLAFNGLKITTRLEVSKFYGQIDLTSFSKKDNIKGFSGDQAVITIGIRADLGLATKKLN